MNKSNVSSLRKKRVMQTFDCSMKLVQNVGNYGISLEFSWTQFREFHHNIYDLYQENQRIYAYQEEMGLVLRNTIMKKRNSEIKTLKLEDILDSIWDITVDKEKVESQLKNKEINWLSQNMQEVFYGKNREYCKKYRSRR